MRRFTMVLLLMLVVLPNTESTAEARARVKVRKGPHRTTVVVTHTHPIRRRPVVFVRPYRRPVVVSVVRYAPVVVWAPLVVTYPDRDAIVWEDAETLSADEDWTDFTLNVDGRGEKLILEVVGKAQLNFAEVVFENGDCQVVDFNEKTRGTGIYSLLDFADGRKVSHVRMVARAKSDEAKIILKMRV